jgi:hypothetical protein
MERNNTIFSGKTSRAQKSEPDAHFTQRESVRHSKLATLTIPLVLLFLLTLLPQAIISKNSVMTIALSVSLGVGICALLLNWRGLVKTAGILTLIVVYTVGTFTMLHYPDGLTASDLYLLNLTIIPDILVLAFFSANRLLPIVCINAMQTWAILLFGPHDSTVTHLLHTAPIEIFSHIYAIQLITAIVLYLWARSTEHALAHAKQTKEPEICAKHEREWQKQELEKKHRLDDGIQQILQTHVAVANGDLNARAPLLKEHELWQVASALNNLIARHQKLSYAERKLRQQIWKENKRSTDQYQNYSQDTGELLKLPQATGKLPKLPQATGELPKLPQATGELPKFPQATGELPKLQRDSYSSREVPPDSPRQTRNLSKPN